VASVSYYSHHVNPDAPRAVVSGGVFLGLGCIIAGLIFTIMGFARAKRIPAVKKHAVAGAILMLLIGAYVGWGIYLVFQRARRNMEVHVEASKEDWRPVTSADGTYSAEMPCQPTLRTESVRTPVGGMLTMQIMQAIRAKYMFQTSSILYPGGLIEDPEAALADAVTGMEGKGMITETNEPGTFQGLPCRRSTGKLLMPDGSYSRVTSLLVFKGNTLFMVQTYVKLSEVKKHAKAAKRFLDSFKIAD
jgi:hypothetical protein